MDDVTDLLCIHNHLKGPGGAEVFYREALKPANCDCPEECQEAVFQAQVSSSQWPALAFWPSLAATHGFTVINNVTVTEEYVVDLIKGEGSSYANALKDAVMVSMSNECTRTYRVGVGMGWVA